MWIVAKTIKEQEFMRSTKHSILCKSKKQAEQLADFMNNHNETARGSWKLKENELYWVYEIDSYDTIPQYRLKRTKGKITIVQNQGGFENV